MIVNQLQTLTKICGGSSRCLSFTTVRFINQKWREEKGLPMNPNANGVLTDNPDYTFLNGKPTPYGINQKRRMLKQKEIAEQIILLTKEVDFAVARHEQLKIDKVEAKQRILDNKLKPKGKLLLKK